MQEQTLACTKCSNHTPLRPDPEVIQRGQERYFDPPLDDGIREIVLTLIANGIETFESCEGGMGHAFSEPTVKFEGGTAQGLKALAIAMENGLPVYRLRHAWGVVDGSIHGPWWEMTFDPPKNSPLWAERNTAARCPAGND
jgi:hypothetical protein